ncbi:bifunctional endo-1,4-beta-xylanase XylA-like [Grus japonensis]|uniref:Bifunctional endo-1,4-beta-xylanase XylA-like n=1 Tax=Grus japonensis TaxID=30415 RepID=A0ABC9XXH1_GRUJA
MYSYLSGCPSVQVPIWLSICPPIQAATAAHLLLSAGLLAVPSRPNWRYEEGINGVFLSDDVQMTDKELRVTAGGLYLLYGQFALTCTAPACPPGTVTLQLQRAGSLRPLLTVPLALPDGAGSDPARSDLAQAIGQLQPGDVLSLVLAGDVTGDGWQLAQDEREGNFVGLLRIAGG